MPPAGTVSCGTASVDHPVNEADCRASMRRLGQNRGTPCLPIDLSHHPTIAPRILHHVGLSPFELIHAIPPHPVLYPEPIRGLAAIVAQWADASLFADRAAMALNLRRARIADGRAQLLGYLDRLENLPAASARDPVAGRLVGLTRGEVVLARVDDRAGLVHVHFPRVGFQIGKAP